MPSSLPPIPDPNEPAPYGVWSVMRVQRVLNTLGYRPLLKVDGSPGPKTADAVSRFQSASGLYVSGKLNETTREALEQALIDSEYSRPLV